MARASLGGDARVDDPRAGHQHYREISDPEEVLNTDYTDLDGLCPFKL
jgi:hypothetical protein